MSYADAWNEFRARRYEFLEFAVASAKRAGKIIMELYNSDHKIEWTNRTHFRSEADTKVSAMLREELARIYPGHNVRSEESDNYNANSLFTWIDDELDGTIPYTRRYFDGFCFSRALCIGTNPVLGVIYMPCKDLLYTGVACELSRLNGQIIRVSSVNSLNEVLMGFCSGKEIRSSHLPFLVKAMEEPNSIMTNIAFACAAAELCFVADGRIEAYLGTSLAPEDMAAAVVILRGAHAKVTNIVGMPWQLGHKSILAANQTIHHLLTNKLRGVIQQHYAQWGVL